MKVRRREGWFACRQFDIVADRMGIKLADEGRYRFGTRLGVKAMYDDRSKTIRFDKKWFYHRSPKARCATLAHELWHSKTRDKALKATRSYRIDLFLRSFLFSVVISAALFVAMAIFLYYRYGLYISVSELPAMVFLFWLLVFFLRYADGGLFKRYSWPLEFESDEASVRFVGADATREVIESFRTRWNTFTHPPESLRLKHVDEVAKMHPVPVIDFETLERQVKQEIVLLE